MAEKNDKRDNRSASQKHIPKDAQVIMSILKDLEITEYEPKVINQLLEFVYKYVTCVLDDAKIYSRHKSKKELDADDVRLAIDIMLEKTFVTPPSRETLIELARIKNNSPLPLIKPHSGLRLPPDRYCLSACNYRTKPLTKKQPFHAPKTIAQFTSILKPPTVKQSVSSLIKQRGTYPSINHGDVCTFDTVVTKTQMNVPKPIIKFNTTGALQKPNPIIKQEIVAPSTSFNIKEEIKFEESMDIDTTMDFKRKREDDDYDEF